MLSLPREAKVNTTIKLAIHADWCQMHKNKGHHSLSWAQEANVCKVATGSPPNHCKIKRIKVVFWNCQSKGSFFFFKQSKNGRVGLWNFAIRSWNSGPIGDETEKNVRASWFWVITWFPLFLVTSFFWTNYSNSFIRQKRQRQLK